MVDDGWLNMKLRDMAVRAMGQGMIDEYPPKSWHSHALRASFETEAEHAGVKTGLIEFFMGHVAGVIWRYNHRDELHEDDLVKEYQKIEPFVSLDPDEASIRNEYEERECA